MSPFFSSLFFFYLYAADVCEHLWRVSMNNPCQRLRIIYASIGHECGQHSRSMMPSREGHMRGAGACAVSLFWHFLCSLFLVSRLRRSATLYEYDVRRTGLLVSCFVMVDVVVVNRLLQLVSLWSTLMQAAGLMWIGAPYLAFGSVLYTGWCWWFWYQQWWCRCFQAAWVSLSMMEFEVAAEWSCWCSRWNVILTGVSCCWWFWRGWESLLKLMALVAQCYRYYVLVVVDFSYRSIWPVLDSRGLWLYLWALV